MLCGVMSYHIKWHIMLCGVMSYHITGGSRSLKRVGHMASAKREPIMGSEGFAPQWGPEAKPMVRGSGGFALLKLNVFI